MRIQVFLLQLATWVDGHGLPVRKSLTVLEKVARRLAPKPFVELLIALELDFAKIDRARLARRRQKHTVNFKFGFFDGH
jgi:hypothetical protein